MATEVERWLAHTPNCHLDCEDHSFKMPSARRLQATKNRAHTAVATSTLQKQLESSLKHIRSRKSHLMLESISELQKKIQPDWRQTLTLQRLLEDNISIRLCDHLSRLLAVEGCAALGKLLEPQDCVLHFLPVTVNFSQEAFYQALHATYFQK